MGSLLRLMLFALLVYVIISLLRIVVLSRKKGTPSGARPGPARVDKTKAQDADFEEIKDK
jgi:hypothetical protein